MAKQGLMSTLRWVKPGTAKHVEAFSFALPPVAEDTVSMMVDAIGLPEVPPEFSATPVEEAVYLLRVASEVEHGLMIQYLYAAYSVDPAADPEEWTTTLANIAVQEMDHLLNVQNMLLALKALPYFDRANYPVPPAQQRFYPFPFFFQPLGEESLAKYVIAESPAQVLGAIDVSRLTDREKALLARATQKAAEATQGTINHVGLLYAKLYWMFQPDDTPVGPWLLPPEKFAGVRHIPPEAFEAPEKLAARQGAAEKFRAVAGPEGPQHDPGSDHRVVWSVRSAADARNAINQIAEQGEGTQFDDDSHFLEFLNLYGSFVDFVPAAGASFPVLSVPTNPTTTGTGDGRIDHPASLAWARLFNIRYQMLLHNLALILVQAQGDNPAPADRQSITTRVFSDMKAQVIGLKSLARRLSRLPRRANGGAERAGAPFELPDETMAVQATEVRDALVNLVARQAGAIDDVLALQGEGAPSDGEKTTLNQFKSEQAAYAQAVAAMTFIA